MSQRALIVVDVQKAFADPSFGPRDNPDFEGNVAALLRAWREHDQPVVFVRHDSAERDSPLRPESPGNAFQDVLTGEPAAIVTKSVNSAFLGDPDLADWLRARRIEAIAVCGIQTNFCCETSARMGANLGFDVQFVLDATHTFDAPAYGGGTLSAAELARVTATNLANEFCAVLSTRDTIAALN